MKRRCGDCEFYVRSEKELNQGECHESPKQCYGVVTQVKRTIMVAGKMQEVVQNAVQTFSTFPTCKSDEWCGRFQPKSSEEVIEGSYFDVAPSCTKERSE